MDNLCDEFTNFLDAYECPLCGHTGCVEAHVNHKLQLVSLRCSDCKHIIDADTVESRMKYKDTPIIDLLNRMSSAVALQQGILDDKQFTLTNNQKRISDLCDSVKQMLLEKNRKYGDSALSPVRCFSKASPVEQIKVRLDDKLSRMYNEQSDEDEDVVMDMIGYLILLKLAMENTKEVKNGNR